MEDSSNGKVEDQAKEVVVEDVKNVEIDDESESVNKREISIFEQVVHKAEDFLDDHHSSSSSSSSSEDEKEEEMTSPEVKEENSENKDEKDEEVVEENSLTSLIENEIPQVLEELVSKIEAVSSVVSGESDHDQEESELPLSDQKNETINNNISALTEQVIDHFKKGNEENSGESTEQVTSNENIAENRTELPVVPVTRDSLQQTSWRSCCGLFEALLSSER
ncbi:hypothetical protein G4B88_027037 [Cannabis sativa]|uniref:Uncharacterized protein n=1 Tax=Cannabis sativa TaxID=3483 RepID=A0A7J6FR38_CANSA|nr:hypothetical protein G4B88_007207 [Cannabis sativa]KAF4397297.1 hypothetical protein G4B88_027037 [Cannabis sativa]